MLDVLGFLVGGDVASMSNDLSRPILDVVLAERPTSRLQSQLLADWFGSQIARLADRGAPASCRCMQCSTRPRGLGAWHHRA